MAIRTRKEIRDRVATDTRETGINSTIDEYVNLTLEEIQNPAWAFEQIAGMRGYEHLWTFNRRKYTLSTTQNIEFYQLPRDIDKMFYNWRGYFGIFINTSFQLIKCY